MGRLVGWCNTGLGLLGCELRRAEASPTTAEMGRFVGLAKAAAQAEDVPGVVVECGVGKGQTLRMLGWLLPDRTLIGYDSFSGYPDPAEEDSGVRRLQAGEWAVGASRVARRLRRAGVRARLVEGRFEATLPHHDALIALLHVDANLRASTEQAIQWLWPWVVRGGVVAFDDYGAAKFPGVQAAVDGWLAGQADKVSVRRYGQGVLVRRR